MFRSVSISDDPRMVTRDESDKVQNIGRSDFAKQLVAVTQFLQNPVADNELLWIMHDGVCNLCARGSL